MESSREEVYEVVTYLLSELDRKCPFQFDQNIELNEHLGQLYWNQIYSHLIKEDVYLEVSYEMQFYEGQSLRPSKIEVEYVVDGILKKKTFYN